MLVVFITSAILSQFELPGAKPLESMEPDARSKAMIAGIDRFLGRKSAEIGADRRDADGGGNHARLGRRGHGQKRQSNYRVFGN